MQATRSLTLLLMGVIWSVGAAAQDRPYELRDIEGAAPPPLIAIAPIEVRQQTTSAFEAADEIRKVLQNDLDFTGRFLFPRNDDWVVEQHRKDLESGRINFAAWRNELMANFLITGEYNETRPGEFQLRLFMHDTATTAVEPAREYKGPVAQLRGSVHLYSDLVVEHLTGMRGIASTIIAFVLDDGASRELWFMDYDGYNPRRKTYDNSIALYPAWSRDGRQLAYTSYKDGGTDLFVLDVFSGRVTRVCDAPGLNTQATWSPDGRELVLAMSQPGNVELFRLPLGRRGAQPQRLTFTRNVIETSPDWSPDGRSLLFSADPTGLPGIYIMEVDGGNPRRLSRMPRHNDNARWSPDGSKITFQSNEAGEFNIYIMDSDGSNVERVTSGPGDKESPSWSPDGQHIVYSATRGRGGKAELWSVSLVTRQSQRLISLNGNTLFPAWGPWSSAR